MSSQSSVAPTDPAAARGISRRTQSEIYRAGISGTKPLVPVDSDGARSRRRSCPQRGGLRLHRGWSGGRADGRRQPRRLRSLAGVAAAAARRVDARPVDRLPRCAASDAVPSRTARRDGDGAPRGRPRGRPRRGGARHAVHAVESGLLLRWRRYGMPRRTARGSSSCTGRPPTSSMRRCCVGPRHPGARRSS